MEGGGEGEDGNIERSAKLSTGYSNELQSGQCYSKKSSHITVHDNPS